MTDILLNYGHFTHLMKIFCMFVVISASCIRLFDRLSDLGVFAYHRMSCIGLYLKKVV